MATGCRPREAESLRDELFYQRAIHAYMTMLPALNVIGMRDGSEAAFGKGYNVLPIWKDRMDCARPGCRRPTADVIYSMSYLDLKETGPLVVDAPPNVIGMFTDFFQRTHHRCRGRSGRTARAAGSICCCRRTTTAHVPAGYFAFKSTTYNVFLFFRTVMARARRARPGSRRWRWRRQTRVYPLWASEKDVKPMEFPNASGMRVNMMYPTDNAYWTKLKAFVDYEPV